MKIFFSGAVRAGRALQPQYKNIVDGLKKYGRVYSGLIEAENLGIEGETELTEAEIYARETNELLNSNLLIAEVSLPSLGVGYQIGVALNNKIEVLCVCLEENKEMLSAMLAGNSNISKIFYEDSAELMTKLNSFFIIKRKI